MGQYKTDFINFLLENNALKIGSDWTLKSKRLSPYFINIGDFNDGLSTAKLGGAYASTISGKEFDLIYGIPEKGIGLAIATAIGLGMLGKQKYWFFTRKIPKEYGEATDLSKAEMRKKIIVGRAPTEEQNIVLVDDVFTTGDAKYEAKELLDELLENPNYAALAIAVDRQEVGIDGKNAIKEFTQKTGIPVVSIVNTSEIVEYLRTKIDINQNDVGRIAKYLSVYGTDEARNKFKIPEQRIIRRERSVIPSCDVSIEDFENIVKETGDMEKIGGYKLPATSGRKGWERWVETARKYTQKPLIYDHQKAGTDIPDTGKQFMKDLKESGFDAVILFPQSGPETERAWIYHALDQDLGVMVGGRMTHPAYSVSEGGFITDEGALEMYRIAARAGINNFVVPGNKPDVIQTVKDLVEAEGISPVFYAPGFIAQGGKIEDATKVAGEKWHAIVGRAIIRADNKRNATEEMTSKL